VRGVTVASLSPLRVTYARTVWTVAGVLVCLVAAVHAAAMGNVRFAEQHLEAAWQVNVGATQNIVDARRADGYRFSEENL